MLRCLRKAVRLVRSFSEPVDLRSRKEMTAYLQNHFRYSTMNSWNGADSYAHNLKIYKLGLDPEIEMKLYDLLQFQEFYDSQRELMDDFARCHQFRWQVGMNGRSGGYLVLYEGELRSTGYLSFCTCCGQKNYRRVEEIGNVCGRCHSPARANYVTSPMQAVSFPGRGVDMDEDYDEWPIQALRDRVRLVQDFDWLADDLVAQAVQFAQDYEIEEVEVCVPQTQRVLVANR